MHAGCPHCGAVLDIDVQYAGHVVSCSGCKQQFRAPAPSAASSNVGGALSGGGLLSPAATGATASAAGAPATETPRILTNRVLTAAAGLRSGNALEALLDFGFRTQGTASLVKILYGLTFLCVTIWLVVGFFENAYYFVEALRYLTEFKEILRRSYNFGMGELMRLLFAVFMILWTRVTCEVAPALLRLTDLATEIERNTKK